MYSCNYIFVDKHISHGTGMVLNCSPGFSSIKHLESVFKKVHISLNDVDPWHKFLGIKTVVKKSVKVKFNVINFGLQPWSIEMLYKK